MNAGITLRTNALFNAKDGRSVVIAADHPSIAGPIDHMEDPSELVALCVESQVDALLMTKGSVDASLNAWDRCTALILRLTGGFTLLGGRFEEQMVVQPETAIAYGASCAAITVKFGHEREGEFIKAASLAIDRCHAMGLPVMLEVMVRGSLDGRPVEPEDPEAIRMAARMGAELAPDIIKTHYTGSIESFSRVVQGCPIPILILGGVKTDSIRHFFQGIADSLEAGGKGVAMGRNIWGQQNVAKMVRAVNGIVHHHWSVEEACDTVGLQ